MSEVSSVSDVNTSSLSFLFYSPRMFVAQCLRQDDGTVNSVFDGQILKVNSMPRRRGFHSFIDRTVEGTREKVVRSKPDQAGR